MHRLALALAALIAPIASAADGLRVAAWNITNYSGGNAASVATAVYGEFEGRSFEPDIILLQEITNQSSLNGFVSALNSAAGSPGDWVGAPFFPGSSGGLNNAVVYREGVLDLLGAHFLWGGTTTANPRHLVRYDVRLVGYEAEEAVISLYPTHMKAGSGSTDQQRRLIEAQRLRADAETLPAERHFILGGDFNIQTSSQAAYQHLIGSQENDAGRFFDPINAPGSWNNNFTFRYIHTQDPIGPGGMDDRYDQLLISASLGDGEGMDYIGSFGQPWDLSTWNDPAHSYRCWGNDGTTFDQNLRIIGNEMVGAEIAQALVTLAGNAGHLPVYLDLMVPAKIGADAVVDFGVVDQDAIATLELDVFNTGDVGLWGIGGIQELVYSLEAPAGFTAPAGTFTEAAGGGVNSHTITMDTAAPGSFGGTLWIASNDPDSPLIPVTLIGEVMPRCAADLAEPYGVLDLADVNAFGLAFFSGDPLADIAEPFGVLDLNDVNLFVDLFVNGCP